MKTKILSLFGMTILTLFLCLTFASAAALELDLVSAPSTATHNSEVTITFNVSAPDSTVNYTVLDWSGSTTTIGTWKTLPTRTSINIGETYLETAILEIPKHASGTINAIIDLQSETSAYALLTIPSITINESKSLSVSSSTIPTDSNSTTITIKNEGNTILSGITLNASGDFEVSFDQTSAFSLSAGDSKDVLVTADSADIEDLITGSVTINASNTEVSATGKVSLAGEFCEYGNPGNDLKVKKINFNNLGIGDDKEWYPYDVIEVEVKIENNDDDDDIDDIVLEWGLYDSNGDWIIEPIEEDEFDVSADDEEVITFEVDLSDDVDLDNLDDGNYDFYVRATGDSDSGNTVCASDSVEIDVILENDFVILTELEVVGTPFCGSVIQVKADVVNIGKKEQKDVYVDIYNSDLKIDEQAIIGDIDAFDDKTLNFEFTIPTDLDEKNYHLHLDIYDEDDDIYESDGDKSKHTLAINVSGNCVKIASAVVYASLESGGKAGQEMQIRASVTNTGSEEKTFTVDAADYSDWAELVSIEPSSLTLDEDEEKDVIITLNVDSDAPEEVTFSIVLEDEDGETVTQPVSATVEKGFSLKGLFGDKGYIWGIAALNILLIIIIILVAIRVSRR